MAEQSAAGRKWLVIVNPNAGNRRGVREWKMISSRLSEKGILYTVKFTTGKGDAISYAMEGIGSGYRQLIIVGGDGTLNEVLNGVMTNRSCSPTEVIMGLIPVGTGNDWGRMLGIPLDHEKAIDIIAQGNVMRHDAGLVKYSNGRDQAERFFINIAGLGFESVVVKRTNHQKDRGRGGKLIYFYNLLMSLLWYRNTDAEITIDGITRKLRIFSLNAGNGKYCGGGMRQTPDALPDDGLLDITVIRDVSKFEIIKSLKLLYNGAIYSHPEIEGHRCTRLTVKSDSLLWVEADGESLGHTPAEFTVIPGAISVIRGKGIIR